MFARIRIILSIFGWLSILAACGTAPAVDAVNPLPSTAVTDISPTPQGAYSTETGLVFNCHRVRDISVEECQALVALYESTDGHHWQDNSGWLVDESPCAWYGVLCQQGPGNLANLYRLDLSHNQLSGSIPAALGDLHNLNWLDLSFNQLNGSIPIELENVPNLYWLDLSYNQLTGVVPAGLAKASREDLRLWSNLLDGTVMASEKPVTIVEFQKVKFEFNSSLAESVWPEIVASLPLSEGGPGWAVKPEHVRFTFASQGKSHAFRVGRVGPVTYPQIFIYPTQEFSAMSELAKGEIEALQALLDARPPAPENEIPLLPLINAAQVFHAQVQYLDFQNGSGVRFITHYSQEVVGRLTKDNIFYTFQGLTEDGAYYIAAFFPISADGLNDEMVDEPWEAAQAHLAEDSQYLDSLSTQAFTPDLELLDSVIQSLVVHSP
jgi:Leucine rich repeat